MRRIIASCTKARWVRVSPSKSLARRRQRPNQPNVRSTIQRFGSTTKPFAASERFTISSLARAARAVRRALVSAIRDHPLQEGKEPPHRLQNTEAAIPILHVARQNGTAEHQAKRVDNGVALAPFDLLGCVIAHRIGLAPPLSAPFTLWLSTMAVVGLASLPANYGLVRRGRGAAAPACRHTASARSRRAR